jgi:hypothetical protein
MNHDVTQQDPSTSTRIDLRDEHDVRYWSAELGCTREQLLCCVEGNGLLLDDLHKYSRRY